jgi:hypothetical protein
MSFKGAELKMKAMPKLSKRNIRMGNKTLK